MKETAYEIPSLRFSGEAGIAVPANRFVYIYQGKVWVCTSGSTPPVGISRNAAAVGEVVEIATGVLPIDAVDALTGNDEVKVGASGQAAKWLSATDDDRLIVAIAVTAAGSGEQATVKI